MVVIPSVLVVNKVLFRYTCKLHLSVISQVLVGPSHHPTMLIIGTCVHAAQLMIYDEVFLLKEMKQPHTCNHLKILSKGNNY